ncbi:sulfite exporter TauE/SafE family protein [Planktothrix mougeotii]|uniref:Probable membrane transporter protein n=1 Tax=Planktothrix mougeotii LEGE 06226 TaxID=1828728 RepID=A0ABR9U9M0_9CYAN|nr:sulfite exporter TauE/SafE family protein [Planktothrix mougeotii]MBE9143148.1 sulfite exporter TauE/SafE family protein [Planktothrix mougeotii LEGE 06226]
MMGILPWILLVALGLTAGTAAGLLGIGGGMLVVPGLFYIFNLMEFPPSLVMHVAIATSMSIMVCTATSSILAHHSKGDVQWGVFWKIVPGILLGVLLGAALDNTLSSHWLKIIFGLFLLLISIKLLLNFKPQPQSKTLPRLVIINAVGLGIGFKSGLLGVGGGAISVPFLIYCGLPMYEVVGTSSSFSLPISILGTLAFLLSSQGGASLPGFTGYIYWPALLLIAPFTILGAFWGTTLSHIISGEKLRTAFALFLLLISLNMLFF